MINQSIESNLYDEISISELKNIVNNILNSNISEIHEEDNKIYFKFKDKDQDNVLVFIQELDDERLIGYMFMSTREDLYIASLLSANAWNQRKDAHDTFAYVTLNDNMPYICLESHLLIQGGVSNKNIKYWIRNLINHINLFEEVIMCILTEIPSDNQLLKNNGFFENLGAFFSGFVEGYFRTINN